MLTRYLAAFGLAAAVFAGPVAAAELPAQIKSAGVLKLTINGTFAPLEYTDPATNELRGLDIDLVDALAARLGLKVERTDGPFAALIPALTTGRSDFILSAISDTEPRRETMDFVDYMRGGARFFVLAGSPIQDPVELCGRKVATIRSTTYPAQIKDWSDAHCVAAGKPAIEVVGAESSPDSRLQLKQGRVEAAAQGGETIPFVSAQEGNVYRMIGGPLVTQYYGAAFRKSDTALRDAIADALQAMIDDGSYGRIFAKWNLEAFALPKILVNTAPR